MGQLSPKSDRLLGEEVDQAGALEAEGAADRRLAGAAVSGAPSDRPGKTVTDSPAEGRARYRSQGRLSSWFVRLCVKSGRFVTSGHTVNHSFVSLGKRGAPKIPIAGP